MCGGVFLCFFLCLLCAFLDVDVCRREERLRYG